MSARAELYDKDGEKRLSLSIVADHVLALCQPKKQRTMKQDERAPAPSPKFDDNPPVWLGLEMNDTPAKENPTIHEILAAQLALHDKAPTSEGESWSEFVAKQLSTRCAPTRKCSAKRSR